MSCDNTSHEPRAVAQISSPHAQPCSHGPLSSSDRDETDPENEVAPHDGKLRNGPISPLKPRMTDKVTTSKRG